MSPPPARSLLNRLVLAPLRSLAVPSGARVPALDALRTVAVLLVLLEHARGGYLEHGGLESAATRFPLVRQGWMGIDLFFVLSGYLVGEQLWREVAARGTIDVGRFLLRRGLRLWPIYLAVYLASAFVVGRAYDPGARWWPDVTFLANYFGDGYLPGAWAIATAQQFYVVAPLLLALGAPRIGPVTAYRKYLWGALALLPLVRALTWWRLTGSLFHHDATLLFARLYPPFHLHADGIVLGLLLSNLAVSGEGRAARGPWSSGWIVPASCLLAAVLFLVEREAFTFTSVALVWAAVTSCLVSPRGARFAWLGWRPFHVLSRLSLGMYLNHRLIVDAVVVLCVDRLPFAEHHAALHFGLTCTALVLASALLSTLTFCLVEHPLLARRDAWLARGDVQPAA